jgi:hypothetical protein
VTPAQLIARAKKNAAPPATLLPGPEAYERRRTKEALAVTYPADAVDGERSQRLSRDVARPVVTAILEAF